MGTADAAAVLRAAGTDDAMAALALLRGLEPEAGPKPVGSLTLWRGRPRRVFRMDELEEADGASCVVVALERMRRDFGPLLERWWAT